MKKIRKAVMAAAGAGAAVALTALQADGVPADAEGWAKLVGGVLVAAFVAGYATWRVPNAVS